MGGDAYINKLIDNKLKSTNDTISVLNQNLSDLNNYVKSICKTRVLIGSYSVNDASNVTVGSLEGYLFFEVEMYSSESKFAHSGLAANIDGAKFQGDQTNVASFRGHRVNNTTLYFDDVDGRNTFRLYGIK